MGWGGCEGSIGTGESLPPARVEEAPSALPCWVGGCRPGAMTGCEGRKRLCTPLHAQSLMVAFGENREGQTCRLLHRGPAATARLEMSPLHSGDGPSRQAPRAGRPPRPAAVPNPPKGLPRGQGGDRPRRPGEGTGRIQLGRMARAGETQHHGPWRHSSPHSGRPGPTLVFPPSLISALPGRHWLPRRLITTRGALPRP